MVADGRRVVGARTEEPLQLGDRGVAAEPRARGARLRSHHRQSMCGGAIMTTERGFGIWDWGFAARAQGRGIRYEGDAAIVSAVRRGGRRGAGLRARARVGPAVARRGVAARSRAALAGRLFGRRHAARLRPSGDRSAGRDRGCDGARRAGSSEAARRETPSGSLRRPPASLHLRVPTRGTPSIRTCTGRRRAGGRRSTSRRTTCRRSARTDSRSTNVMARHARVDRGDRRRRDQRELVGPRSDIDRRVPRSWTSWRPRHPRHVPPRAVPERPRGRVRGRHRVSDREIRGRAPLGLLPAARGRRGTGRAGVQVVPHHPADDLDRLPRPHVASPRLHAGRRLAAADGRVRETFRRSSTG